MTHFEEPAELTDCVLRKFSFLFWFVVAWMLPYATEKQSTKYFNTINDTQRPCLWAEQSCTPEDMPK